VFKLKRDSDGNIARYKATLVARGFTQEHGVDYHETFAPIVRVSSDYPCGTSVSCFP
jgi:hypothetical protein